VAIIYVNRDWSDEEILAMLRPYVAEWFRRTFETFTPPQRRAIPLIKEGKNVLVFSPTGSGKTLAAFLFVINWLFELGERGELGDGVYVVYISPLRALANDIRKNLLFPLEGIRKVAEEMGIELPEIRVFVRTGDTSSSEKAKMLRKAPHILITTPESLAIVLCAPKFCQKLSTVRYVIVDEVHELCDNKRGVHLSLSLERLRWMIGREFIRIGLSATQAPLEEIAKWLVGYREDGELRDVAIVDVYETKKLDIRVVCPVKDLIRSDYAYVNARMYELIRDLVKKHRTTLIFTNTRSGAESVTFHLKQFIGDELIDYIATHHGSLSRDTRLTVEDKLKRGELKAVVTSTSLELGIDIGYIDLVIQIGSPKSVAKGLQRVGRAGHYLHEVSKGRFIVFDRDDLIECTVLIKAAYDGKIDRVQIPKNCLDVLAQHIVGMSINAKWDIHDAYKLIRCSYCYHDLSWDDYLSVLRFLGGEYAPLEYAGVYRKIWLDLSEGKFGRKKSSRMIYFLNVGTIPEEAEFKVIDKDTGMKIGMLSEKFLERLNPGDVFVLGGKTYEYLTTSGMTVFVRSAFGKRPTVPTWVGEMLPRSFDLSIEVGKFREEVVRRLLTEGEDSVREWLVREYYLDEYAANSIINYFLEQLRFSGKIATHRVILIEEFFDDSGKQHIIFHAPFGRRVNDALSRAYAYKISNLIRANVGTAVNDDGFLLVLPSDKRMDIHEIPELLNWRELREVLRRAVKNTELFRRRFQHVAARSFMILKRYKGVEISLSKQQLRASRILDLISEWEDFPVVKETYREILEDVFDVQNAEYVLREIERGNIRFDFLHSHDVPSPFAHGILLVGISDVVIMEDRQTLLRELHRKVLQRISEKMERIPVSPVIFPRDIVERVIMQRQHLTEETMARSPDDLLTILFDVGALPEDEIVRRVHAENDKKAREIVRQWLGMLEEEGKVIQVRCLKYKKPCYIPMARYPVYYAAFRKISSLSRIENNVLRYLRTVGKATEEQIAGDLNLDVKTVKKALKSLEEAYLVHRRKRKKNGKYTTKNLWCARESIVPPAILESAENYDVALAKREAIMTFLRNNGPSTLEEIERYTRIPAEEISKILSSLEMGGEILSGKFVDYKPTPQVISRDMYEELSNLTFIAIPAEVIEKFYARRSRLTEDSLGTTKDDIVRILKDCGPLNALMDKEPSLKKRMKMNMEEIQNATRELWRERKVLWIRCLRGLQPLWIVTEEYPIFRRVYEQNIPLNDLDRRILDTIKAEGPQTIIQLKKKLKAKISDVRVSLQRLESNFLIIRVDTIKDEKGKTMIVWDLPERVLPAEILERYQSLTRRLAQKKLIEKFLWFNGPSTVDEICEWSGLNEDEIRELLNQLEMEGKVVSGYYLKYKPDKQWVLRSDIELLKSYNTST